MLKTIAKNYIILFLYYNNPVFKETSTEKGLWRPNIVSNMHSFLLISLFLGKRNIKSV